MRAASKSPFRRRSLLFNDAFLDFAGARGLEPVVVTKRKAKNRVGLLVHP